MSHFRESKINVRWFTKDPEDFMASLPYMCDICEIIKEWNILLHNLEPSDIIQSEWLWVFNPCFFYLVRSKKDGIIDLKQVLYIRFEFFFEVFSPPTFFI